MARMLDPKVYRFRVKLFLNEREMNIDSCLSWLFFAQKAARHIPLSLSIDADKTAQCCATVAAGSGVGDHSS